MPTTTCQRQEPSYIIPIRKIFKFQKKIHSEFMTYLGLGHHIVELISDQRQHHPVFAGARELEPRITDRAALMVAEWKLEVGEGGSGVQ